MPFLLGVPSLFPTQSWWVWSFAHWEPRPSVHCSEQRPPSPSTAPEAALPSSSSLSPIRLVAAETQRSFCLHRHGHALPPAGNNEAESFYKDRLTY